MDIKKIIDILTALLEDHKTLLRYSYEIKRALSEDYDENILEENMKERGLLIDKIASSTKYHNSIKECRNFADNSEWKTQVNELLQQIQQSLNETVIHNEEIAPLIKQRINDITFDLEKIQEGKHLVNNLRKHASNTSSFIDICG